MKNPNILKTQLKTGFPYIKFQSLFALCGQAGVEDFKEFKAESWTDVINLRSKQELETLDFDVKKTCRTLDLNYNNIPIIKNGEFNKEALKDVHDLLNVSNKKYIIHCASGMRSAIAVVAHLLFLDIYEIQKILEMAKELGLSNQTMLANLFNVMKKAKKVSAS